MDKLDAIAAACKAKPLPPVQPVARVDMQTLFCDCGCLFLVPETVYEMRVRDGRPICCPNGHRRNYGTPPEPKMDDAELLRRHEEEQREAREADGRKRRKGAA